MKELQPWLFVCLHHTSVNLKTLTNENTIDSCQCNRRRIDVCNDSLGRPLQSGRARYRWRSTRRRHRRCNRRDRRRRAWCCGWCGWRRRCRGCRRGRSPTPRRHPPLLPSAPPPLEPLVREIDPLAVVLDDPADHPRAAAVTLQDLLGRISIRRGNQNAKADPHIVDLEHFGIADVATLLNHLEYRWNRRHVADQKTYAGIDTREI